MKIVFFPKPAPIKKLEVQIDKTFVFFTYSDF